jgi:hypothetical protein
MLEQHSRLPEATFYVVILCGAATLGLGVAYFVRLAHRLRRGLFSDGVKPGAVPGWIVFPAALSLMLSSAATHWPATIRFHLSKPSFDEVVAQVYTGQKPQGFPRRVGLYWIDYVKDDDFNYDTRRGRIGFVTGVALLDECGIYYDEDDPGSSHWLTTRIAPRWYLTEW